MHGTEPTGYQRFGAICRALLATAAHARQNTHGETMEIHMTTATAFKPSAPKQLQSSSQRESTMKWTGPRIVEIAVGLEINSYACAERS
jgi:coenzyme PQQ precursor peptide PqqA